MAAADAGTARCDGQPVHRLADVGIPEVPLVGTGADLEGMGDVQRGQLVGKYLVGGQQAVLVAAGNVHLGKVGLLGGQLIHEPRGVLVALDDLVQIAEAFLGEGALLHENIGVVGAAGDAVDLDGGG